MTTSSQQLSWMRTFAIIQGSLFFDLKRKCQTNMDQDGKPFKQLDKLNRLAKWHHFLLMFLYITSCIRYIPVILIRLNLFERLKPWDCLLVGRFAYLGRTSGYSPFMAFALYHAFIFYRHRLAKLKAGGPFRFYALEFMFYEYEELVKNEVRAKERDHRRRIQSVIEATALVPLNFIQTRHQQVVEPVDRVLYLENAFHSRPSERFILRPNRSSASWLLMAKYTRISLGVLVVITLGWLVFVHFVIAGNAMTKKGFELNYRACTFWLRQQQQLEGPNYLSFIHQNNGTLAFEVNIERLSFFVPLEDFVEMSVYSWVRIFFDLVENNLWFTDFWLLLAAMAYTSYLNCIDLIINSNEIKKGLSGVVARMRLSPPLSNQANYPHFLKRDICRIQATLLDHLVMVRGYNFHVSFYLFICILVWFQESVIVCIWTGVARSRVVELEFATTEAGTFLLLVFLLSGPAVSKRASSQLYRLVSNAAALDQVTVSKRRWAIITKYFYPRSDYCFTLFDSIELSWLFCLKLLSWNLSAVLVLANFFYMYQSRLMRSSDAGT